MRYAKSRRPIVLPTIQPSPTNLQQMLLKEQCLTAEVDKLNQILKADRLTTINGFIFTTEVKARLPDDILECINKEHRLLAYGFELMRHGGVETRPVKMDLVHIKPTFREKLLEISIKSVEKYELEKQRHLQKMQQSRWKVNSTAQSKVSNRHKFRTELMTNDQPFTSNFKTKSKPFYDYETAKKIVTEASHHQEQVGTEEVQKMLKKFPHVVSIWLPPKTYPQFYGIVIPSFTQSSSGVRCRIKKYMIFKQGLNERFFNGLLSYLSQIFHAEINSIQMIMTKTSYLSYFKNCGWKMKSWEGVDKINALFAKSE